VSDRPSQEALPSAPVCPRHPDRESYVRCQRCERPVCPECQRPAAVGVQCIDCVRQQTRGARQPRTTFGGRVSGERPTVTLTLIGACVAMFVLQQIPGLGITSQFAFYPILADMQPWRFLTAAFLHSPSWFLHIAFNMYALWLLGPYLEGLLGRLRFAVLYLVSALGGSVGYLLLADPLGRSWVTPTVGASGAVFGLFGAIVVVNRRLGRQMNQILVVIAINGVIGFLVPGIAWQAHLGGLVTGAAVAGTLAYAPRVRRNAVQLAGVGGITALLVLTSLAKLALA
jgi:membrane associated rhomboid family serine protease